MQFDHISASRTLVQAVHVLGDEEEGGKQILHLGESEMGWIGRYAGGLGPALSIPSLNARRITSKGVRAGKFFRAILRPEPARFAEGSDTTLSTDAGTGERYDTLRGLQSSQEGL
jgi:hypothetical protein